MYVIGRAQKKRLLDRHDPWPEAVELNRLEPYERKAVGEGFDVSILRRRSEKRRKSGNPHPYGTSLHRETPSDPGPAYIVELSGESPSEDAEDADI